MSEGSSSDPTPIQVALRHKYAIGGCAFIVAVAVYVLLHLVKPLYSADASLMIDGGQLHVLGAQEALTTEPIIDAEWTHTEMAALASPSLARDVVRQLGLTRYSDFQDCSEAPSPLFTKIRQVLDSSVSNPVCKPSEDAAVKALLKSFIQFSNDRQSYIIVISAQAESPALAVKIADAYANAFVSRQRAVRQHVAEEAVNWLSTYVDQAKAKMLVADAAVETFRQSHNLVSLRMTQTGTDATETVRSQRLGDTNTDLSQVDAMLAEKRSTLGQAQALMHGGGRIEALAPVLQSPTIQIMMEHHAELVATLSELRAQYGDSYHSVMAAQAAVTGNDRQIRLEVEKAIAGLNGEVAALTARKDAIEGNVRTLETKVAGESSDDVKLRELERDADTQSQIYQTLLGRIKEIGAQQVTERGDASIAVEASPPEFPSYPKKALITLGSFLAAIVAGVSVAFALSFGARRFGDAEHVEEETGLPVIGLFADTGSVKPQDIVLERPMSLPAEGIHAALIQISGRRHLSGEKLGKIALITSPLPGEGKTSFCVALARSASQSGMSVFVLDCDLRRPSVERMVLGQSAGSQRKGPVSHEAPSPVGMLDNSFADPRGSVQIITLSRFLPNPRSLSVWPGLPHLLNELRARYDLVLIDTAPVLAVADVLPLAPLADEVIMVVNWKTTRRASVTAALRTLRRANVVVSSILLTRVDLKRYRQGGGAEAAYSRHYKAYHKMPETV